MGKITTISGQELAFAQGMFASYYRVHPTPPPPYLHSREFGFALFGTDGKGPFVRHRAFKDATEFVTSMSQMVPRHTYYSTAIYEHPGVLSMKEKKWERAEVIFDIDADHLRGAEGLTYPEQLELAKKRFTYLLDEFIMGDFGVDERDLDIVFSGGRGYHAHVRSAEFEVMGSAERRELVDYIQGIGFKMEGTTFSDGQPTSGGRVREFRRLSDPSEAGWRGRVSREVLRWFSDLEGLSEEQVIARVVRLLSGKGEAKEGAVKRRAKSIAKDLSRPEVRKVVVERHSLEIFRKDEDMELFVSAILKELSVPLQGETDAPVTTDVHRLIRLPFSLHGGTGFVVKPLKRSELDAFEPARDALPDQTTGERVRLEMAEEAFYDFGVAQMGGKEGEFLSLPPSLALFLVLRGEARLKS